jgi:hypothetical protein
MLIVIFHSFLTDATVWTEMVPVSQMVADTICWITITYRKIKIPQNAIIKIQGATIQTLHATVIWYTHDLLSPLCNTVTLLSFPNPPFVW